MDVVFFNLYIIYLSGAGKVVTFSMEKMGSPFDIIFYDVNPAYANKLAVLALHTIKNFKKNFKGSGPHLHYKF